MLPNPSRRAMRPVTRLLRHVLPALALMLGGCFGGSVAQQLASTMAMQAADHIADNVVESRELGTGTGRQDVRLADREPDPYWADFVTAGFEPMTAQAEPLPQSAAVSPTTAGEMTATPLLRVEIWNLVVGEEKRAFLEDASRLEAEQLPRAEWARWQVATGSLLGGQDTPIMLLIPPEFGRVASGERAVVEVSPSGLYYARHALN